LKSLLPTKYKRYYAAVLTGRIAGLARPSVCLFVCFVLRTRSWLEKKTKKNRK